MKKENAIKEAIRTKLCMFCDRPQGPIEKVRDEGHYVTTGKTVFEYGCLACREKFGLKTRKQLAREAWRKKR